MTFYHEPPADEYGEAKRIILQMLWDGATVLGDDILATVKQAYYDRRIRELRDEDGWDIETTSLKNREGRTRPAYRLKSHVRGTGYKRPNISQEDRKFILKRDNFSCQICGISLKDGRNNPQIDHKVPLIRGGPSERGNYQAICSNDNLIKRSICRICTLPNCDNCYLAYPQKGANNIILKLSELENEQLTAVAEELGVTKIEALHHIIQTRLGLKRFD